MRAHWVETQNILVHAVSLVVCLPHNHSFPQQSFERITLWDRMYSSLTSYTRTGNVENTVGAFLKTAISILVRKNADNVRKSKSLVNIHKQYTKSKHWTWHCAIC